MTILAGEGAPWGAEHVVGELRSGVEAGRTPGTPREPGAWPWALLSVCLGSSGFPPLSPTLSLEKSLLLPRKLRPASPSAHQRCDSGRARWRQQLWISSVAALFLAPLGLGCGTQGLRSSLWLRGCLAVARGVSFPTRDRTLAPCAGSVASQSLDTREVPAVFVFF